MNIKFLLSKESMLQAVEDNYIKFVAERWDSNSLLKEFTEYLNSFRRKDRRTKDYLYRIHVNLHRVSPDTIIFESSRFYLLPSQKFSHRQLWVFNKLSDSTYDLSLNRFKIIDNTLKTK